MDDFEVLIGTRYGELNEKLAKFLEELERGGFLITAMVEDAILGRHSQEVETAFSSLHSRAFSQGEGDPGELFKKLMTSFSVTFREISKDKVTSEMLKLIHRDISTRCDQIDQALQLINENRTDRKQSDSRDPHPALLKIARGLQSTTKQVRVGANKGPRSVDISKIYIPPKLRHRDTKRNTEILRKQPRSYVQRAK